MKISRNGIGNIYNGDIIRIEKGGDKFKLECIDMIIDDKDVADFCLNCTKESCSGSCANFNNFMKERNKKNGKRKVLHP